VKYKCIMNIHEIKRLRAVFWTECELTFGCRKSGIGGSDASARGAAHASPFADSMVSPDFNARVYRCQLSASRLFPQHAGLTVFMRGIVSCVTRAAMAREAEVLPAYET
jgi:hypothetical protein